MKRRIIVTISLCLLVSVMHQNRAFAKPVVITDKEIETSLRALVYKQFYGCLIHTAGVLSIPSYSHSLYKSTTSDMHLTEVKNWAREREAKTDTVFKADVSNSVFGFNSTLGEIEEDFSEKLDQKAKCVYIKREYLQKKILDESEKGINFVSDFSIYEDNIDSLSSALAKAAAKRYFENSKLGVVYLPEIVLSESGVMKCLDVGSNSSTCVNGSAEEVKKYATYSGICELHKNLDTRYKYTINISKDEACRKSEVFEKSQKDWFEKINKDYSTKFPGFKTLSKVEKLQKDYVCKDIFSELTSYNKLYAKVSRGEVSQKKLLPNIVSLSKEIRIALAKGNFQTSPWNLNGQGNRYALESSVVALQGESKVFIDWLRELDSIAINLRNNSRFVLSGSEGNFVNYKESLQKSYKCN